MDRILEGAVDLHIHAGPSVANRELDAAEMLKLAEEAKYKAFVVKDHYFPTMFSTIISEKHVGNGTVKVFGGLCLNNSMGLFNLNAVDAAYNMGAKFICMPTLSARQHIEAHKGSHFAGAGHSSIEERPVYYLNDKAQLIPEVKELLAYLATKPDLILYTGHGCAQEVDVLINEAIKVGVKKILVNHPFFNVGASYEQMSEWSKLGAYIEVNAGLFPRFVSFKVLNEVFNNVSLDQIAIDTDSGQKGTGSPVEILRKFVKFLMKDFKISEADICKMIKENPSKLLEI
ncbi:MAG: DUF6282 family protein [Eubacteriales bacterium]